MTVNQNHDTLIAQLLAWYGDGSDGAAPTKQQWAHVLSRPKERPITLVNFFKMRDEAIYPASSSYHQNPGTGEEAFARYAEVSIPTLAKIGGKFLSLGPFEKKFIGTEEDWDVTAIAHYPNSSALIALYEDQNYRQAFNHRTAACAKQQVSLCTGQ